MKMNIAKTILAAVALAAGMQVSAATYVNSMTVESNGSSYEIALAQEPKVTFVDSQVVISYGSSQITFPDDQEVNFTFSSVTSLEELQAKSSVVFYWDNATLHIYNLQPAEQVAIYGVNGVQLYSGQADNGGSLDIDIDGMPSPAIVRTANQSLKFTK